MTSIALIGNAKTEEIAKLQQSFEEKNISAAFLKLNKVGMLTEGKQTRILAGTINFRKYDAVYLEAEAVETAFVEPFLDELAEEGIYCQLKPGSFYITSNKPYMHTVLNSKGLKIPKMSIFQSPDLVENALKRLPFPVLFRAFSGTKKMQELVIDSERSLKSVMKGMKKSADVITLQEYLEDDIHYCFVIGESVYAVKKKWNAKKFEHVRKGVGMTLPENEAKVAKLAAKMVGADIATVKIISGRVINVMPKIDFERFNNTLGRDMQSYVVSHYAEALKR